MEYINMKECVGDNPLLAILRGVPDDILLNYAGAIFEGGVRFFEVAMNTKNATEQIARLRKHFGKKLIIGAGTAITVERAEAAINAGAEFLLTPSTDEPVLKYAHDNGIQMLPGVLTPTDVSIATRYGFNVLKLFPAGDMPVGYIKSLKGPFDNTDYIAIGGVSADNIEAFMSHGFIGVGLGSNILRKEDVINRDWQRAAEYVKTLFDKAKIK